MSCGESDAAEAVRETLERMGQAVTSGDFDGWRGLWHRDAREFAPNAPAAVGRTNVLYGAKGWFENWIHDMKIRCDEVHTTDCWAFASGSLTLRSVSRQGEESRLLSARFLAVLTDPGDGRWLMYRYCYNSGVPLAGGR